MTLYIKTIKPIVLIEPKFIQLRNLTEDFGARVEIGEGIFGTGYDVKLPPSKLISLYRGHLVQGFSCHKVTPFLARRTVTSKQMLTP
jgi:hypothetical protein